MIVAASSVNAANPAIVSRTSAALASPSASTASAMFTIVLRLMLFSSQVPPCVGWTTWTCTSPNPATTHSP